MTTACRSCGTELPPRAKHCPECGAPTGLGKATVPAEPAAPPPPEFSTTPAKAPPASTAKPPSASSAPTLPPASSAPTLPPASSTPPRASSSAATLPPAVPGAATLPPEGGPRTVPDEAGPRPPPKTVAGRTGTAGRGGDEGPLAPGQSFGSRYHVKRLLGLGGMGAVYQAWDTELSVDVAIKLIRPEIMADPEAAAGIQRRFKRELLLARLVTHKNVVRIHDLGEIDGIKYITMSYVDGTDLATILGKEGKLTVPRVLRLARRIVSGLVAAHGAGVVHRDLKPANVMVGKGDDALIMDFGIARMTADAPGDVETGVREAFKPAGGSLGARYAGMTRVGSMVGTVEYMAPEQARGEQVDQRADVYAFGLMLYDMLAGPVRTVNAESPLAEMEQRTKSAPLLKKVAPHVPDAFEQVIRKCIEPDREKRFQTSAEVKAALNRLDAEGRKIPAWRAWGLPRLVAVAATVLAATSATWWYFRPTAPPPPKDPVSVVIADFANRTRDTSFDRTLEPVTKLAFEGASFITAFTRSDIRRGLGVTPPDPFDERAARELAVKQGLNVVVSGAIEPLDGNYRLLVTATQAVTGAVIAKSEGIAAGKEDVLSKLGELAEEVRQLLGDDASDAKQRFAMETLTATSLDVVHDYALAMDAMANSRFDEAREYFGKAVATDPEFGLAYTGLAAASRNVGNEQDAKKYAMEAVRRVDKMTERERFRARGQYYIITSDYPSCAKEFGSLLAKFQADPAARNNLALCASRLRDMPKALAEMKQAVKIMPNRALYRVNLALYAAYASDFQAALAEAQKAREMSPLGHVPLGFAQVGLGRFDDAAATFASFAKVDAVGASHAASGNGDIAIYQGRYADAVKILEAGAAKDLEGKKVDRAAAKFAAIAFAEQSRGRQAAALWNARRALEVAPSPKIKFLAGRILAQEGRVDEARQLAAELAEDLQVEPRVHGKILEAELLLAAGEPRKAIPLLTEANAQLDTWIGRFTLGRAYVAAGAWPQADSEFDRLVARRGEALALFLDEEPTFGIYPLVLYYQGQVRQGLGTADFAEPFRQYLQLRGGAGEDRLLADVRKRLEAVGP